MVPMLNRSSSNRKALRLAAMYAGAASALSKAGSGGVPVGSVVRVMIREKMNARVASSPLPAPTTSHSALARMVFLTVDESYSGQRHESARSSARHRSIDAKASPRTVLGL